MLYQNMIKPKVSVIVPVYNVEKYLDRCVQSIRKQTLSDIEIILVDDGSPDKCPAMCDEYARQDSRIKVVHKQNAGLGMACNSGIEVAGGEYIAFVDSDDYIDLNCYEFLYTTAVENKADAVYSGIKRVDENGNVSIMSQATDKGIFETDALREFQFGMIASSPDSPKERDRQMSAKIVLYSGKIINDYNIRFRSERKYISEDLFFNLDFLRKSHKVIEIPNAFYYYFVNMQSLTQKFRADRCEKIKDLQKYLLTEYDYGDFNQEFRLRVDKMFIGYMRTALRSLVESNLTTGEKRKQLRAICDDPIWTSVSSEYPIKKLPLPKRIIYNLTRYKCYGTLYLLLKLIR